MSPATIITIVAEREVEPSKIASINKSEWFDDLIMSAVMVMFTILDWRDVSSPQVGRLKWTLLVDPQTKN